MSATATFINLASRIDGSFCEGGGQLIRNTVSLAALLSKPILIDSVRSNRTPPGLRKQHESGIKLAAEICSAETSNIFVGSTHVGFRPGHIQLPKTLIAEPGTAASTALLLQVALPCLLFSSDQVPPSVLTLRGGTNASQAPQIDYTRIIFLPFLKRHFGLDILLKVQKRGYFPKGGGSVYCSIQPVTGPLPAVSLTERGGVVAVKGEARVGGLPITIANEMSSAAKTRLIRGGLPREIIRIDTLREKPTDVHGKGGGIVLWAETENGCIIGGTSVSVQSTEPREVGEEAAIQLLANLQYGQCVDEYLQDQIIIFLALAKGTSTVRTGPLTDHTKTAIHIAQLMTGAEFRITKALTESEVSGTCIITCDGVGFTPLEK
ncbi:RNA 3'-terminal phosphate cyclase domain-containing protein [Hygrophoropsis aurantiaca]|uniref:RNA 3'-terminal phosphate cyclase domain-containing protein n=1 Tax=Hygrophoropsis aurantiaca TaxID=72124 RepID=A0ACB7ZZH4_9AGAM|nr:RNA 3'-terminal phosphate cyclase domain-containing protein [Hygrophoropsis aurantiaca]